MTRITTQTMTTGRLLLAMTATLALALGIAFASPAAAQFVDESDEDASEEQTDDADGQEVADDEGAVEDEAADQEAPASNGNGFVGNDHDDEHEAAPVGGIDAGFGGGAERAGFGVAHAGALALLVLALTGHATTARRTSSVRA